MFVAISGTFLVLFGLISTYKIFDLFFLIKENPSFYNACKCTDEDPSIWIKHYLGEKGYNLTIFSMLATFILLLTTVFGILLHIFG